MKKTVYITLVLMLVMVALPSYAKALSSQKVIDFIMKKAPEGASVKLIKDIPIGETGFSYLLFDYKVGGQSKQISFVSDGSFATNSFVELETGRNITEYYEAISKTIEIPVNIDEIYFGDPETAKVKIIVFSDFECPPIAKHSLLNFNHFLKSTVPTLLPTISTTLFLFIKMQCFWQRFMKQVKISVTNTTCITEI